MHTSWHRLHFQLPSINTFCHDLREFEQLEHAQQLPTYRYDMTFLTVLLYIFYAIFVNN